MLAGLLADVGATEIGGLVGGGSVFTLAIVLVRSVASRGADYDQQAGEWRKLLEAANGRAEAAETRASSAEARASSAEQQLALLRAELEETKADVARLTATVRRRNRRSPSP